MIWLSLVSTLALAQDGNPLDLPADVQDVAATAANDAPASPSPAAAPPVEAVVERPAPKPAPTPASATMVTAPVDTGWLFSFGGPLVLLLGAGGLLWYIRKNGLKVGGLSLGGLNGFRAVAAEGPQVRVAARTPLAGQDVLAVVEVSGIGTPRHLLVTAGPGGSRLVADLTPQAAVATPTADNALSDMLRQALGQAWTAPQGMAAPTAAVAAPAPVPVMAAAAPVAAAPAPAPTAPTHAPASAPSFSSAPPPAAMGAAAASVSVTPSIAPPEVRVAESPTSVPRASLRSPGGLSQGEQGFDDALDAQMSAASQHRPSMSSPRRSAERPAPRSALQGRAKDWRSATYLQSQQAEEPPREEDLVDVIGEYAHQHRKSPRGSVRGSRGRAGSESSRRRQGSSRGHLEQLARDDRGAAGRHFGGDRPRRGGVLREAGSRQERTEAARALLEKVMAQRREDRR